MPTSIIVTAEHVAPVYAGEQQALARIGQKESHSNCRWAIWLVVDEEVRLLAHGLPNLGTANEHAAQFAKDMVAGDETKKVVRSN